MTNPRKITDEMVIELYKKTTLSNKVLAECLLTLQWKNRKEISKYIINDRVNKDNVLEYLEEYVNYAGDKYLNTDDAQEIYELLLKIKNSFLGR